jgi:putative sterol carrier protein
MGALSVDALMVALEATFSPENAGELRAVFELRLGDERYTAEISQASLSIARGTPRRPDAIIETDSETLRAVVFGDQKLAGAALDMQGDTRLAKAFLKLFKRP